MYLLDQEIVKGCQKKDKPLVLKDGIKYNEIKEKEESTTEDVSSDKENKYYYYDNDNKNEDSNQL